jgi:hypothetical protein
MLVAAKRSVNLLMDLKPIEFSQQTNTTQSILNTTYRAEPNGLPEQANDDSNSTPPSETQAYAAAQALIECGVSRPATGKTVSIPQQTLSKCASVTGSEGG